MLSKLPPYEKAYEAFSTIADNRIEMHEDYALVSSSDLTKTYEVKWKGNVYSSSDSATYWQSYPGYPVIAVLMLQGKLPMEKTAVSKMSGIPWKKLNTQFKRDYHAAAEYALKKVEEKGISTEDIRELADEVNQELKALDITVKKGRLTHKKAQECALSNFTN